MNKRNTVKLSLAQKLSTKDVLYMINATALAQYDWYPLNTTIDVNVSCFNDYMDCHSFEEIQQAFSTVLSKLIKSLSGFLRYYQIPIYYFWVKECPTWKQPFINKWGVEKNRDGYPIDCPSSYKMAQI